MAVVTIAIFVFGLLLQRRREYITLRAQGLESRTIRILIAAEAGTVATAGVDRRRHRRRSNGLLLRHRPQATLRTRTQLHDCPLVATAAPVALVLAATILTSAVGSRMVLRLQPTELLRDE